MSGIEGTGRRGYQVDVYVCEVCGYIYTTDTADPEGGIEPGTPVEELPADWACPECSAGQASFRLQEELETIIRYKVYW